MRKGEGRGLDGGVKLFRSSSSNLDGGAASVITSSIFVVSFECSLWVVGCGECGIIDANMLCTSSV